MQAFVEAAREAQAENAALRELVGLADEMEKHYAGFVLVHLGWGKIPPSVAAYRAAKQRVDARKEHK